jgi:hypothetical protein
MMTNHAYCVIASARRRLFTRAAVAGILLLGTMAPARLPAANLGAVLSYEKTAHGIAGRTATVDFSVEVWSSQIIRVRVTPQGVQRNVGYALATDEPPEFSQFSVSESDAIVSV